MLKKRPGYASVTAGWLGLCATAVPAAVLGAGSGLATMGQPLDVAVGMRIGAHEAAAADCLSAEVHVGDRRLTPSQFRVRVEPAGTEMARVRVQTLAVIDEPVVTLTLASACGDRAPMRYVLLADPASTRPSSVWMLATANPAAKAELPRVDAALLPDEPGAPRRPLQDEQAAASVVATESLVLPASVWQAVALRQPAAAGTAGVVRRARATPRNKGQLAAGQLSQTSPRMRRQTAYGLPRLRLDAAAPRLAAGGAVEQALQAVAQATSTARQAASSASAAADRIAALERTVEQLRGEAQNSASQTALLRDQIAQSESPTATWMLGSACGALVVLAGWLAVRLSAARRARADGWEKASPGERTTSMVADTAGRPATAAMAFVHSDIDDEPMSASRTRPVSAWPTPAPSDRWTSPPLHSVEGSRSGPVLPTSTATTASPRTVGKAWAPPAPSSVATAPAIVTSTQAAASSRAVDPAESGQARDVSIDELLDLEQQAEFFVVLGQDDAAVELLVEHLRHTGGGSPLPYLKLLEIHRRRDDRSDYERTRARFNLRFNAYAPEWEIDLQSGLSLDNYPGVLTRLQQVWPRPLDSMPELAAMLVRRSQGELFDLPAYRELLLLYAVARDLLDRQSAESGNVDLLLPLSDSSDFSRTSPTPFMDLGREARVSAPSFEASSTVPVDLDLSLNTGRPSSIFDLLQEPPAHPRKQ